MLTVVAKNGDTVPMDVSVRTTEGVKTFGRASSGAALDRENAPAAMTGLNGGHPHLPGKVP